MTHHDTQLILTDPVHRAVMVQEDDRMAKSVLNLIHGKIGNENTRIAYLRVFKQFFEWMEQRYQIVEPSAITTAMIGQYLEGHPGAASSVNQHRSALGTLFKQLAMDGIVPFNPVACTPLRPIHRDKGTTPILSSKQARHLLDSIPKRHLADFRDRAMIGMMLYTFARVSAVCKFTRSDYYEERHRDWIRLHEKRGTENVVPVHPKLKVLLEEWLERSGITDGYVFHALSTGEGGAQVTDRPVLRSTVMAVVKRRCRRADLPDNITPHSFRATGITTYLEGGGTREIAQRLAGHKNASTTMLYDRRTDEIDADEICKIII